MWEHEVVTKLFFLWNRTVENEVRDKIVNKCIQKYEVARERRYRYWLFTAKTMEESVLGIHLWDKIVNKCIQKYEVATKLNFPQCRCIVQNRTVDNEVRDKIVNKCIRKYEVARERRYRYWLFTAKTMEELVLDVHSRDKIVNKCIRKYEVATKLNFSRCRRIVWNRTADYDDEVRDKKIHTKYKGKRNT